MERPRNLHFHTQVIFFFFFFGYSSWVWKYKELVAQLCPSLCELMAPLGMEFSRQNNPGIEPRPPPRCRQISYHLSHQGSPKDPLDLTSLCIKFSKASTSNPENMSDFNFLLHTFLDFKNILLWSGCFAMTIPFSSLHFWLSHSVSLMSRVIVQKYLAMEQGWNST